MRAGELLPGAAGASEGTVILRTCLYCTVGKIGLVSNLFHPRCPLYSDELPSLFLDWRGRTFARQQRGISKKAGRKLKKKVEILGTPY